MFPAAILRARSANGSRANDTRTSIISPLRFGSLRLRAWCTGVDAARAAALLGGTADVVGRADSVATALELVRQAGLSAIVCAASANEIVELGRACASQRIPLFNLASADDALRNAECSRFSFHVA